MQGRGREADAHVPALPAPCLHPGPGVRRPQGALGRAGAHLDAAVVDAGGLALDAAGVTAPGTALHLHARGPDQEVGRRGVDLAPRYLINDRPGLADRRDGFLCRASATVSARATPHVLPAPRAPGT